MKVISLFHLPATFFLPQTWQPKGEVSCCTEQLWWGAAPKKQSDSCCMQKFPFGSGLEIVSWWDELIQVTDPSEKYEFILQVNQMSELPNDHMMNTSNKEGRGRAHRGWSGISLLAGAFCLTNLAVMWRCTLTSNKNLSHQTQELSLFSGSWDKQMYLWLEMHFRVQVALGTLCIMCSPLELSYWIQAAAGNRVVAFSRGRSKPWRSCSVFLIHPVSKQTLHSVKESETKGGPLRLGLL